MSHQKVCGYAHSPSFSAGLYTLPHDFPPFHPTSTYRHRPLDANLCKYSLWFHCPQCGLHMSGVDFFVCDGLYFMMGYFRSDVQQGCNMCSSHLQFRDDVPLTSNLGMLLFSWHQRLFSHCFVTLSPILFWDDLFKDCASSWVWKVFGYIKDVSSTLRFRFILFLKFLIFLLDSSM